jgi:benzoate/toluate 1,2-dioxygenase reductase subunit
MPAWDDNDRIVEDPQAEISLIYYAKRSGLEDRVFRIKTERSSASTPEPRTSHNISNVEILSQDDSKIIDADESESIADAAYRQGINVPLGCTNGVCGTCKAFRQSGEFGSGSYTEDALSDAEAAEGYVLCCQAKAQSDMVINILASSGACKVKPKDTMAEILKVEALSAHRIRLSVKPLEGALPMFLPGQYVNVTAPNATAKRPYSFTSAPGADVATFLIRNVQGGQMSTYLAAKARTGDRLVLNGPFGSFYLRAPRRPILFLAGGTGVGPILSMLEHLAARGANDQPVRLVYGARDDADLVEVERIEGSERGSRNSPMTPPVRAGEASIR